MQAELLVAGAGTVLLALWLTGVAGWLGTGPDANWTLFVVGCGLVVLSGARAVLPRGH
ncbi:MAG TPA: hypothetical protein VH538_13165 [Gaiellaceae bacterium]